MVRSLQFAAGYPLNKSGRSQALTGPSSPNLGQIVNDPQPRVGGLGDSPEHIPATRINETLMRGGLRKEAANVSAD